MTSCAHADCDKTAHARGYCRTHYRALRKTEELPLRWPKDPITRFWFRVSKQSDCWIWLGARNASGYGVIHWDDRDQMAHRIAYELEVGPISPDRQIDHLCRNRACVNPDHLEPVTMKQNIQRAMRTYCRRGHEYTEENVYWYYGKRHCRACQRENATERYRQARSASPAQAECERCGASFEHERKGGKPLLCSEACRRERQLEAKRRYNQKRKRAPT